MATKKIQKRAEIFFLISSVLFLLSVLAFMLVPAFFFPNAKIIMMAAIRRTNMMMLADDGYVGGNSRLDGHIRVEQTARIVDVDLSGSFRFT